MYGAGEEMEPERKRESDREAPGKYSSAIHTLASAENCALNVQLHQEQEKHPGGCVGPGFNDTTDSVSLELLKDRVHCFNEIFT